TKASASQTARDEQQTRTQAEGPAPKPAPPSVEPQAPKRTKRLLALVAAALLVVLAGAAVTVALRGKGANPGDGRRDESGAERRDDKDGAAKGRAPRGVAERLRLDAAEKGDAASQYEMGRACYYGEKGQKVDHDQAARWFALAEKQGHLDATAFLGFC